RAYSGEDVTADLAQLNNRWSALSENYSTLGGTRSEAGRILQLLNPNKPLNMFVADTAKLAQELGLENNPQRLSDLLAGMNPDQYPRIARQMSEDVGMGRKLYNAFNEYYYGNLLSNVGRTASRVG